MRPTRVYCQHCAYHGEVETYDPMRFTPCPSCGGPLQLTPSQWRTAAADTPQAAPEAASPAPTHPPTTTHTPTPTHPPAPSHTPETAPAHRPPVAEEPPAVTHEAAPRAPAPVGDTVPELQASAEQLGSPDAPPLPTAATAATAASAESADESATAPPASATAGPASEPATAEPAEQAPPSSQPAEETPALTSPTAEETPALTAPTVTVDAVAPASLAPPDARVVPESPAVTHAPAEATPAAHTASTDSHRDEPTDAGARAAGQDAPVAEPSAASPEPSAGPPPPLAPPGYDHAGAPSSLASAPTEPRPTMQLSPRRASLVRFVTIVTLIFAVLMILFVALPRGRSQDDTRLFVSTTLDLEFETEIERESITPAEYAKRVADDLTTPDALRDTADQQALYASLGLLTPKQSLEDAMRQLVAEPPSAYYDRDSRRIVVVEEEGQTKAPMLAAEYTLALFDQRLELDYDGDDQTNSDRRMAARAFLTGVSALVETAYATGSLDGMRVVTERPSAVVEERYLDLADERKQPDEMPAIVIDTISYPYVIGFRYAHGLARRGVRGEEWLDLVPESTEQLARMEATWLGHRDHPLLVSVTDVTEAFMAHAPDDEIWRAGEQDAWGHWFLARWLDRQRVSWDGDRVYTFYRDRAPQDATSEALVPTDVALVIAWVMDEAQPEPRYAMLPALADAVKAQLLHHASSGKLVEACFDAAGEPLQIDTKGFAAKQLDGTMVWRTEAGRVSAIEVVGQDVFAIMNVPAAALNDLRAACFGRLVADVRPDDYSTPPPETLEPRPAVAIP